MVQTQIKYLHVASIKSLYGESNQTTIIDDREVKSPASCRRIDLVNLSRD
jgi:hypothetical protein